MTATEDRSTDQLRTGDVVLSHGMRLVIDRPINEYPDRYFPEGKVYATSALIANADELRAEVEKTGRNDYAFILSVSDRDGTEYRWRIQGNHLAHWAVVTA